MQSFTWVSHFYLLYGSQKILLGAFFLLIGVFGLLQKEREEPMPLLFIITFFLALKFFGEGLINLSQSPQQATFWLGISSLGEILTIPAIYHFSTYYANSINYQRFLVLFAYTMAIALYLPGFVNAQIFTVGSFPWGEDATYSSFSFSYFVYAISLLLFSLYNLTSYSRREADRIKKAKIQRFILAVFLALFALIDLYISNFLKSHSGTLLAQVGFLFSSIFLAHELIERDLKKREEGYLPFQSTVVIVALVGIPVYLSGFYFYTLMQGASFIIFFVGYSLFFLLLAFYIRVYLSVFTRIFFQKRKLMIDLSESILKELSTLRPVEELQGFLDKAFLKGFEMKASLSMLDEKGNLLAGPNSDQNHSFHYPLFMELFRNNPRLVTYKEIMALASDESFKKEQEFPSRIRGEIYLPLVFQGNLLGILVLAKIKKEPISPEEIEVLEMMQQGLSIAVNNNLSYSRIGTLTNQLNNMNVNLKEEIEKKTEEVTHANEELQQTLNQLKDSEKQKEILLNFYVHDLKNPLTASWAYLDLIDEGNVSPEIRGYAAAIRNSNKHMLNIISNLLDLYKVQKAAYNLKLEKFPLHDLIKEVIDEMEAIAKEKEVKLVHTLKGKAGFTVESDRYLILRVLENLLINGIKFSSAGDTIRVGVEHEKGDPFFLLQVSDEGTEIPEAEREKIFNMYYQGNAKGKGFRSDKGLGLAFCRAALTELGGSIWVESREGRGNIFNCRLPVSTPERAGENGTSRIEKEK